MLNKLHSLEQQAAQAQCLALLVEFVKAVRAQKVCPMCRAKAGGKGHELGCAMLRADAFIKSTKVQSGKSRRAT